MKRAIGILALLPVLLPVSAQQQPAGTPHEGDARTRLDVKRVSLLFTVSDKKGRFVTNLDKEDFQVFESKKSQNILEFNKESNLPLRLAILIDTSNSIRERFKFQQEA